MLEAPTRHGPARLELGPASVILQVGDHRRVAISPREVSVTQLDKRKPKKKSYPLADARLIIARGNPTEDVGLWYEPRAGMMRRVFGLQQVPLLDHDAMQAWKDVDRLAKRLANALSDYRGDVVRAAEFGRGADRVLMTDDGHRYTIYVRRLFRERQRRALEVHDTGKLVFVTRHGEQEKACYSRFGVTVLGDRVRFAEPDGTDIGSIWLPWIAPEDRHEIARLFAKLIDQGEPATQTASR